MADFCVFCRILSGDLPGQFVYQDDQIAAFRDIHPITPVHVLVVPREHIDSLATTTPANQALLGLLLQVAVEVAGKEGLAEGGYRVAINTGPDSGSEVFHLHLHVLGGRQMGAMG